MRISQLLIFAAVLAAASPALAQDRNPEWLKRPTPEMLRALFPAQAIKKGADGRATISCIVTVQGALRACEVLEQSPAGLGFGDAALALTPQLLFRPALKDGKPVEATVRIPINWSGVSEMDPTATPPQSVKVFTNLPWRAAPSVSDVLGAYPEKAREAKIGGMAVLDCRIGKDGSLSHCRSVRQEPTGYGFGLAAKELAPLFNTPVEMADGGTAAGARAHLNVAFSADMLDGARPVIGKPMWVGVPQVRDMAAVIPEAAKKAQVYQSRVVLECEVVAEGAIDRCSAVSQDLEGLGYGDAAVALSKYFRLEVWTEEGLPVVGGRVRLPLRFDARPEQTPSPADAPAS